MSRIPRSLFINLRQLSSSLPSLHSDSPEHTKDRKMHVRSLVHWNWSSWHVLSSQFNKSSSSPFGQSLPPSQSHCRSMQVFLSSHKYSVGGQMFDSCEFVQFLISFWQTENEETINKIYWCWYPFWRWKRKKATYEFIWTIRTVDTSITYPIRRNACSIAACELINCASVRWAIRFIAAISTILTINKIRNEKWAAPMHSETTTHHHRRHSANFPIPADTASK